MKDFRKFCRPKIKKHSNAGDILLRLKCGETGAISLEEYLKVLRFFKAGPFTGQSNSSAGKVVVKNKKLGTTATFDIETYNLVKDNFEIELIIGEKLIYDPSNGYDYVEIGGIKWATKNIGATNVTDYGQYFQWGDIQGYTADQVGSGEGQKYFGWADYKYSNGTSSPGATGMTKYNSSDGKTVLETSDDAAVANMGGSWRMPTEAEFNELLNTSNCTKEWTNNYNGTGIKGYVFTSKSNSNTLFFPAAGSSTNGSVYSVGSDGDYWSSSLNTSFVINGRLLFFDSGDCGIGDDSRCSGCTVRGVLDDSNIQIPENSAIVGDLICYNSILDREAIFSYSDLSNLDSTWQVTGIYGEKGTSAIQGDIICYNSTLQRQAIFSYDSWINLNSDWNAVGLYGIETFNIDDEVTEERKVISSNGTTFIIKSEDLSKVNNNWTVIDTIYIPYLFVDLGLPSGTLWATKNVGANTETDYGLYFQWGDTEGYTAAQVGSGSGQKAFTWNDYKYNPSGNGSTMTKYNSTDGLVTLQSSDDAAVANMGGSLRMPTVTEFNELLNTSNCTKEWITNYNGTGINGYLFTSVRNGNTLFFPAAGRCKNGSVYSVGSDGDYWSSSLSSDMVIWGRLLLFTNGNCFVDDYGDRCHGYPVRGVVTPN